MAGWQLEGEVKEGQMEARVVFVELLGSTDTALKGGRVTLNVRYFKRKWWHGKDELLNIYCCLLNRLYYITESRIVAHLMTCDPMCCLLGNAVRSDPTSSGPRSGKREDGPWARDNAHGKGQRPEPGRDGSRWGREPHGGGPQTQSPGHSGGDAGGEGGANTTLCGKN